MRYYYEKPKIYIPVFGETYICDHPVYNRCTLYKIENVGLAVIQQRYNPKTKKTWWSEIDPWLRNELYLNPGFYNYFKKFGREPDENDIYPTVTIRQMMWALKMKPMKKERWETVFDHAQI